MPSKALRRVKPAAARIQRIRGLNVVLDADLAVLYRVRVSALNQAVKRHRARFPPDFMFQLQAHEATFLRSQSVILDGRGKHRKYAPYVITEQGVGMLSSVLRSRRAVAVNIEIMRAFVALRRMMTSHEDLMRKLAALEQKYDKQFSDVFAAIRSMMLRSASPPRRIGFRR